MKAFLTGGSGFLGRYIAEQLLERGDSVTFYGRSPAPELEEKGAIRVQGDLRDAVALSKAAAGHEVFFHTAAHVGLWGRKSDFVEVNIGGTKNVLKACHDNGIKRLVFTGSPSVVYQGESLEEADETLPYPSRYSSYYPETKAAAEQLVIQAAEEGLLTCSLRPHLLWGPKDNHLIPNIIKRAQTGRLFIVGDGKNLVDFTYIENAARAHLLAADHLLPGSPVVGQCYFIGQDEPVALWDFVSELLTRLNIEPPRRRISRQTARTLGIICEWAYRLLPLPGEPRLTGFLADQLATSHYFSNKKAREHFGYIPQISMEEGMRRLVAELQNKN